VATKAAGGSCSARRSWGVFDCEKVPVIDRDVRAPRREGFSNAVSPAECVKGQRVIHHVPIFGWFANEAARFSNKSHWKKAPRNKRRPGAENCTRGSECRRIRGLESSPCKRFGDVDERGGGEGEKGRKAGGFALASWRQKSPRNSWDFLSQGASIPRSPQIFPRSSSNSSPTGTAVPLS
jgi:hypothetical protein